MMTTGLFTLIASTIIGAVFKLIATKMESSKQLEEAKLRALNAQAVVTETARKYENRGFQVTRRFIAITATTAILILPIISPLLAPYIYPNMLVADEYATWFGYDVVHNGFWPFTSDSTETVWKQMKGMVITPEHWNIMNAIIGLYFGDRLGSSKR